MACSDCERLRVEGLCPARCRGAIKDLTRAMERWRADCMGGNKMANATYHVYKGSDAIGIVIKRVGKPDLFCQVWYKSDRDVTRKEALVHAERMAAGAELSVIKDAY